MGIIQKEHLEYITTISMKRYIKDGIIKQRNQIVLHGTRTIKDKDGNEKEVKTQIINPKEKMLLADGWEIVPEPTEEEIAKQKAEQEVRVLKRSLSDTDYKVIKCMESYLCGESLPYDIRELHAERDEQRRIINENEM